MADFTIFRSMDWSGLKHEYGLDGSRLRPWENYPMPFSGAWCVVRPGTVSDSHTQIDQEIFIAIKGSATLVVDDKSHEFGQGDIAAIPKHVDHYVENNTDEDFHFYVVWWDEPHAREYLEEMKKNPEACHA
ncbi:cupin domain-containing protein [Stappia sp. ES.058]|uniref:cupin domain-containing protein n=1 Tax=Stappia sp. ES.058 TaxID=1881061 RepID=UPI000879819B|nr:cupin domain-containing protein [Stappia sp. ES.058]SDU18634.1 Mannose-6-phosphate isomerase, cupin superfamily [Stappia sp. ES.058]